MISELSIGISLWHSPPVQHEVTRVLFSSTHKCLVSGAMDGRLLLWNISSPLSADNSNSSEASLNLQMVLVGHRMAITGLASCTYQIPDASFVSASYDGTVCVWDFEEGRCIASAERLLTCKPTSLVMLPSGFHFACSGDREFNDIVIVNLRTLEVSVIIPAYPNNVSSLFCCNLDTASVLVSAGVDGIVQFWSLKKGESNQPALQTACLEIGEALAIAVAPNYRSMIVVTQKQWMLYSAKEFVELMSVNAPEGTTWSGGAYVTSRTALAWSSDGNGYLYVLPDLSRTAAFLFVPDELGIKAESQDEFIDLDSYSDVEVKAQPNFRMNFLKKLNIPSAVHRPLCSFVRDDGNEKEYGLSHQGGLFGDYFVVGDENGQLRAWKLPPRNKRIDASLKIKPCALQSSINFGASGRVTASTILEKLMWIAVGYENGKIGLGKIPNGASDMFELENAHEGKISSLLSWIQLPKKYLISGGEDRYIKVWSIKDDCTLTPLWTFSNHSGPVLQLFKPPLNHVPNALLSDWKSRIFSLSEDKTICLFGLEDMIWKHTFGPHPNAIVDVKWNIEQDYLLVKCEDNSVSVWEISTGLLENVVYGGLALEIFEHATQVLPKENKAIQYLDQAINSTTIDLGDNTPVQMLFINARLFVKSLQKGLKPEVPAHKPLSQSASSAALHSPRITSFSAINYSPEQLAGYKCLSYLLPWNVDTKSDQECQEKLNLIPPDPNFSFGISGAGGNLSIFVPRKDGKTKFPSQFSTLFALTTVAALHTLSQLPYFKDNAGELLKRYSNYIATQLNGTFPSLTFLARYWRDSSEEITQAARLIFSVCAQQVPVEERIKLVNEWASHLRTEASESRVHAILGLGVLGSEISESLNKDLTKVVVEELVKVLSNKNESTVLRTAAAELLGKGYKTWKPFINNVDTLIHTLFSLSLTQNGEPTPSTGMAQQALLAIGAAEPKRFVTALGTYILEVHYTDTAQGKMHNVKHHAAAIATLGALIKNEPYSLLPMLPRVVETVVQSLDPHVPTLRDMCLQDTTKVLHILVKQYPTISFHQDSQRLAVGTKEGPIVIYDLKTATRSHVLEGHTGSVSTVSFAESGKQIASYSIFDNNLRIWQTSSSFFPLISAPRCVKVIPVSNLEGTIVSDINPLESIRIRFASPNSVELFRSWEGTMTIKI